MAAIELVIEPRERDLGGGFKVRRILPYAKRRMVGPFIFLDHMGPTGFPAGGGIDVRPHPHIGLATVTYLFEGEILHRDSLGSVQAIRPGAVNWMTAGRGIAHSERTAPEVRRAGHRLHGLQSWVALPVEAEEAEPAFSHHPSDSLPSWREDGVALRLIAGTAFGRQAAVPVFSPIFYLDIQIESGARWRLPDEHEDRALYVVDRAVDVDGQRIQAGRLAVLRPGLAEVQATEPARVVALGGAKLAGERHIWWNLVSSRKERIEEAKADWKAGRFAAVPGETEFIPLPE
jgi:redox-sensitive bicupin YhaK (pirin superfamily)